MDDSRARVVTLVTRSCPPAECTTMRTLRPSVRVVPRVPMPRRQRIDCPHERRPGMALCLHCLHAERLATRDRRQRIIIRMIAWTLSVAVVAVVGAAGVNAATKRAPPPTASRIAVRSQVASSNAAPHDSTPVTLATTTIQLQGSPTAASPVDSSVAHATTIPPAVSSPAPIAHADSTPAPSPVIGPIIPQGRTDLQDSLYAVRRGDTVVVNFDTGPARTRRADKFELVVRQTLHSVFGPVADTLLTAIPVGKLVAAGELVTTLPKRGVHLQGAHGPHVALWPQTKPGRDGPLVFAYRTVVER